MQEPHWHLRLHLPPRHKAPAGLRGGLHRYRRASPPHPTIDKRVQSQRARGQVHMGPGGGGQLGGTLASLPPCRPALSLLPQMMMNAVPSPPPVPTAAASTPWVASIVSVMRATSPAPASPSARVSVTRSQCGITTWEFPEVGDRVGATGGVTQPVQTRVHRTPPASFHSFSHPPPHRNMRACPCCPIITPRKRPSPSSPLHGAKPGGRPSGTRCPGDLSVLVPRVLVAFSLHTSAPGAQSPPLSFRPGGCIQLPPIPPQPPRPPDAVHTRTSSEPRLSDALIPTQTPQARLPK